MTSTMTVVYVAVGALAAVLMRGAADHLFHRTDRRDIVDVMGGPRRPMIHAVVGLGEGSIAVALALAFWHGALRYSLLAALVSFILLTLSLMVAHARLERGAEDVSCGCGVFDGPLSANSWHHSAALAVASVVVLIAGWNVTAPDMGYAAAWTYFGLVGCTATAHASYMLLNNRATLRRLEHSCRLMIAAEKAP